MINLVQNFQSIWILTSSISFHQRLLLTILYTISKGFTILKVYTENNQACIYLNSIWKLLKKQELANPEKFQVNFQSIRNQSNFQKLRFSTSCIFSFLQSLVQIIYTITNMNMKNFLMFLIIQKTKRKWKNLNKREKQSFWMTNL